MLTLHVGDGEHDELGAPERAEPSHRQQRAIAETAKARVERADELLKLLVDDRRLLHGCGAVGAPDPYHDRAMRTA